MGLIQNMIKNIGKNKTEFKEKLRQAQEDKKINDLLEERSKSSNERELEKIMKKKREEKIKSELQRIRKQENKELWKSKDMVIGGKTTMLNNERPILKEKNIFHGNQNLFSKEHSRIHKTDMGFWK